MTPDLMTVGRSCGVRLTDVPLKTRRMYGRYLVEKAAKAGDLMEAMAIHRAVEHPSDKVYWLPEAAVRKVMDRGR